MAKDRGIKMYVANFNAAAVRAAETAPTLHHDEPTGAGCFSLGYVVTYVRQLDDWKGLDEITIETTPPPVLASIPGGRGVRLIPQAEHLQH